MKLLHSTTLVFLVALLFSACQKSLATLSPAQQQKASVFKVLSNHDEAFADFNKKVEVFGIPIYAVSEVEERKLLHAANILAEYLDNNEDAKPDNEKVHQSMLKKGAFLVMWKYESDLDSIEEPENAIGQDLGADETNPLWHKNPQKEDFDASLEEVWHLISHAGYSQVYPSFYEQAGSALANAMDKARGGRFFEVPNQYPKSAWYSYEDETCEYDCMLAEYFYWGLTSLLGAQEHRAQEIEEEWRLPTKKLFKRYDKDFYKLLNNPAYNFPTRAPDGIYKGKGVILLD